MLLLKETIMLDRFSYIFNLFPEIKRFGDAYNSACHIHVKRAFNSRFYYFPVVHNCELLKFKLRIRLESEDIQHQNVYFFSVGSVILDISYIVLCYLYINMTNSVSSWTTLRCWDNQIKAWAPIPHILKSTAWAKMTCVWNTAATIW